MQQPSFSDLMKCSRTGEEPQRVSAHLDFDVLAVDDLHDADDVIKHQARFLTVVCQRENKSLRLYIVYQAAHLRGELLFSPKVMELILPLTCRVLLLHLNA